MIVHEAALTGGFGAEIAARIAERGLLSLQAPLERVAGYDTIMPLPKLEHHYLPSEARIVVAARASWRSRELSPFQTSPAAHRTPASRPCAAENEPERAGVPAQPRTEPMKTAFICPTSAKACRRPRSSTGT